MSLAITVVEDKIGISSSNGHSTRDVNVGEVYIKRDDVQLTIRPIDVRRGWTYTERYENGITINGVEVTPENADEVLSPLFSVGGGGGGTGEGGATSVIIGNTTYPVDADGVIRLPATLLQAVLNAVNDTAINIQTVNKVQRQTIDNANALSYFARRINTASGASPIKEIEVTEGYNAGTEIRWQFYAPDSPINDTIFTMNSHGVLRVFNNSWNPQEKVFATIEDVINRFATIEDVINELTQYARKEEVVQLDPSGISDQKILSHLTVGLGNALLFENEEGQHNVGMKIGVYGTELEDLSIGTNVRGKKIVFMNQGKSYSDVTLGLAWLLFEQGTLRSTSDSDIMLELNGNQTYIRQNNEWLLDSITFPDDDDYIITGNNVANVDNVILTGEWRVKGNAIYDAFEQLDINSTTMPVCINHNTKSRNGVIVGRNPQVDILEIDGVTKTSEKLAFTTNLPEPDFYILECRYDTFDEFFANVDNKAKVEELWERIIDAETPDLNVQCLLKGNYNLPIDNANSYDVNGVVVANTWKRVSPFTQAPQLIIEGYQTEFYKTDGEITSVKVLITVSKSPIDGTFVGSVDRGVYSNGLIVRKTVYSGDLRWSGSEPSTGITMTVGDITILAQRTSNTVIQVRATSPVERTISLIHSYRGNNTGETLQEDVTSTPTGNVILNIETGNKIVEFWFTYNRVDYYAIVRDRKGDYSDVVLTLEQI